MKGGWGSEGRGSGGCGVEMRVRGGDERRALTGTNVFSGPCHMPACDMVTNGLVSMLIFTSHV